MKLRLPRPPHLSPRRSFTILIALVLVIGGANLIFSGRQFGTLQTRTQTVCSFWADIGTAPITEAGVHHPPSRLAVTIVTDARHAWYGLTCPGTLPPPSSSLRYWAAHYRISVNRGSVAVGRRSIDKRSLNALR